MRSAVAICFAAFAANLPAADPFLGTWKLNLERSKFEPGPAPRSLTLVWTDGPAGMKIGSTGVRADGRPLREE
ncbi:MAG TPA: hypothetical protein VGF59_27905 [Bryobacteraceae bacterium]|jgi:hypothetical protein